MESVEDAWAKINFNGKVAYVNANYLEEVEVGNLAEKDENLSFLKNILPLPLYGERWTWIVNANVAMTFVWAIFILSCFLLWVHRVRGNWLEGWRYKLNIVVFLSLSIIEVVYMAGHGDQALWFYGYAGYGALGMFVYLILYILVAPYVSISGPRSPLLLTIFICTFHWVWWSADRCIFYALVPLGIYGIAIVLASRYGSLIGVTVGLTGSPNILDG